jgi:hypothetical protein
LQIYGMPAHARCSQPAAASHTLLNMKDTAILRGCGALLVVSCIAWVCVACAGAFFSDIRSAKNAVGEKLSVAQERVSHANEIVKEKTVAVKDALSKAREQAALSHKILKERVSATPAHAAPGAGPLSGTASPHNSHSASQDVPPA